MVCAWRSEATGCTGGRSGGPLEGRGSTPLSNDELEWDDMSVTGVIEAVYACRPEASNEDEEIPLPRRSFDDLAWLVDGRGSLSGCLPPADLSLDVGLEGERDFEGELVFDGEEVLVSLNRRPCPSTFPPLPYMSSSARSPEMDRHLSGSYFNGS